VLPFTLCRGLPAVVDSCAGWGWQIGDTRTAKLSPVPFSGTRVAVFGRMKAGKCCWNYIFPSICSLPNRPVSSSCQEKRLHSTQYRSRTNLVQVL